MPVEVEPVSSGVVAPECPCDEVSCLGAVVVGSVSLLSGDGADDVLIVLLSSAGCADASVCRASAKAGGNSRPLLSARRKIPAAALGLKKNLAGTVPRSTSANDEDASPPLGHSEVSAVQHSPGEVVKPDVAQRADHNGEISSTGGTEQAGDVLNNDPSSWANKLICDPGELKEKPGSLPGESGTAPGD